jgi:hypothetical protein
MVKVHAATNHVEEKPSDHLEPTNNPTANPRNPVKWRDINANEQQVRTKK